MALVVLPEGEAEEFAVGGDGGVVEFHHGVWCDFDFVQAGLVVEQERVMALLVAAVALEYEKDACAGVVIDPDPSLAFSGRDFAEFSCCVVLVAMEVNL